MLRYITGMGRKRRTFKALVKEGWHRIPEVMFASLFCCAGLLLGATGIKNYFRDDGYHSRYRKFYVVYRPDDPHATHIKGIGDDVLGP